MTTESAWDRGVDSILAARDRIARRPMPGFPATLEKLLAMKEWRGSTVTKVSDRFGDQLVIRHPCGAEMRIFANVFERKAEDKRLRQLEREAKEANRVLCACGRRVDAAERPHKTPNGDRHRFKDPEKAAGPDAVELIEAIAS